MTYPHTYRLQRPKYQYSDRISDRHQDKLRGLLQFGPYRNSRTRDPVCLFVFKDGDREHANNLYLTLRNGVAKYPGLKTLVGIAMEKDRVAPAIVGDSEGSLGPAFVQAIESAVTADTRLPDFAFVIYSKEPASGESDPYPWAKAALTRLGIPSQYVSWELLDSEAQFRYAISNVALNMLVKLGGVPWTVAIKRDPPDLNVGIGRAEVPVGNSARRRLVGFAVCTLANGVYVNTSFFPPAEDYQQFLIHLRLGLRNALGEILQVNQRIGRITVHVSQFEKRSTVREIERALMDYEPIGGSVLPFELVRLVGDSDFQVLDLAEPGYVSEEGTVVMLSPEHALLVTEGRREKAVWRGRKPVTLEVRRQFASSPGLAFATTVAEAFSLSSVNWRGFNAVTQPVTLQYAELLARQVAKMASVDSDIPAAIQRQPNLHAVPWFI